MLKNKSSNKHVEGKVEAKINGSSHILFDNNIILWIKRMATVWLGRPPSLSFPFLLFIFFLYFLSATLEAKSAVFHSSASMRPRSTPPSPPVSATPVNTATRRHPDMRVLHALSPTLLLFGPHVRLSAFPLLPHCYTLGFPLARNLNPYPERHWQL